MRILIAEDDATSRLMLASVLRKAGHEVLETADGAEAWAELQRPEAPKIAILDWMMPAMDGLEVVRRVRELQTDRPPYILMLTTRTEKAEIVAGLTAGANDYVAKPFDAAELQARVEVGRRMIEMQDALAGTIEELRHALAELKTLRGIVPICAGCKKIRDDQGYWNQVEVYVEDHTEAQFSHGLCPECIEKTYSDFTAEGDTT